MCLHVLSSDFNFSRVSNEQQLLVALLIMWMLRIAGIGECAVPLLLEDDRVEETSIGALLASKRERRRILSYSCDEIFLGK